MTFIKNNRVSASIRSHDNPNNPAPSIVLEQLVMQPVVHLDFTGVQRVGVLIVHRSLVPFVRHFFESALQHRFRIASVTPIREFGWDDELSATHNNTSAFNYRCIGDGSGRLSAHATGEAFDVNPLSNPCYWYNDDGEVVNVSPQNAKTVRPTQGRFGKSWSPESVLKRWSCIEWGGHWNNPRDLHHFQIARSQAWYMNMQQNPP